MVSDSDLVTRLCEILRDSDLDTATAASVRRKLEEGFGVNLSDRKAFIREQIDIYLETLAKDGKEEETVPENVNQDEGENKHDVVEEENEEEEDSEGEEESETKTKGSNKAEKGVRKRGGFTKLCSLSPKLQKVVGVPELARTEVVKKLWAYIRENGLQDPSNRKNIKCDEALRELFCVKSINMFQMNKALSKHIWPLTEEAENEKLVIKDQVGGSSVLEGEDPSEEQENEEEEEEEEEEDIKKKGNAHSKKGRSIKGDKDGTKRGGGFAKLCSLSPQLQNFIGVPEMARTEVVKRIWAYIREKNLQDPKDKRNIMCDESLHALFRVDRINMFKMNKVLSKHIWPLNEEDENEKLKIKDEVGSNSASDEGNPSEEQEEEEEEQEQQQEQEEEVKKKGNEKSKIGRSIKGNKSGTKRGGGFTKLCSLSPQLQEVIGVPELARTEVVKRIWAYIREKNLQDPNDKRNIICDESLHALFQVDSINMFQMNKALSKHIWPINAKDAPCNSSEKEKHGREEGSNLLKQKEKRQKK